MRGLPAVAVLAVLSLLCAPAFPASAEPQGRDVPESLYARMERAAAGVSTISSDFVMEKHLAMFRKAVTSKGRFLFRKPDLLRWETTEPVASGFVLNGNEGRRWHERTGGEERFDVRRDPVMRIVSEQILAWAKPDFAWLRKEYRIRLLSEDPLSLRLDPLSPSGAGMPDHLRITLSADERTVRTVEIHDKDGDFTVIRFVGTVLNRPIPPSLFE